MGGWAPRAGHPQLSRAAFFGPRRGVDGAREIEALFPPAEEVRYVPRDAKVVAEAARRFTGALRFDPVRYIASVEARWGEA